MAIDWKHVGKLTLGMLVGSIAGKFFGKKIGLNQEDIVGLPELGAVVGVSMVAALNAKKEQDKLLSDFKSDKSLKTVTDSYKFRNTISAEKMNDTNFTKRLI